MFAIEEVLVPAAAHPELPSETEADQRLNIAMLFTSVEATLTPLKEAGTLVSSLGGAPGRRVTTVYSGRIEPSRNHGHLGGTMQLDFLKNLAASALCFGLTSVCNAQNAPAPAPAPLTTPSITGPLQAAPPTTFEAGPLGKLNLDGIVSGMGLWQGNHVPGDEPTQAAVSNGQAWIQKTDGWFQFYVQAGAYNIPALATPFLATGKTISDLYGPVPVGFVKLAPAKNFSIMIGALPTLMGAEYTFTFENMNIERGLLWNQENAINRGIQVNQTIGKFTASLSWNDGFYSNRYSWVSGSLTYANEPHSLTLVGMGNLGQTTFETLATPVQNNGSMYALIYTYTKGSWIVQPYFQYTDVPTNRKIGVVQGASTRGGAILVNRTFKHGFSLPGRLEFISSSGNAAEHAVNLLFGPGGAGWSITLTPTFQYKRFFIRGDLSFVRATSYTSGSAFGPTGMNRNQPRGVIEAGFLF